MQWQYSDDICIQKENDLIKLIDSFPLPRNAQGVDTDATRYSDQQGRPMPGLFKMVEITAKWIKANTLEELRRLPDVFQTIMLERVLDEILESAPVDDLVEVRKGCEPWQAFWIVVHLARVKERILKPQAERDGRINNFLTAMRVFEMFALTCAEKCWNKRKLLPNSVQTPHPNDTPFIFMSRVVQALELQVWTDVQTAEWERNGSILLQSAWTEDDQMKCMEHVLTGQFLFLTNQDAAITSAFTVTYPNTQKMLEDVDCAINEALYDSESFLFIRPEFENKKTILLKVLRNGLQWTQGEFQKHAHRKLAFMQCLIPPKNKNDQESPLATLGIDNLLTIGQKHDTSYSPFAQFM